MTGYNADLIAGCEVDNEADTVARWDRDPMARNRKAEYQEIIRFEEVCFENSLIANGVFYDTTQQEESVYIVRWTPQQ